MYRSGRTALGILPSILGNMHLQKMLMSTGNAEKSSRKKMIKGSESTDI